MSTYWLLHKHARQAHRSSCGAVVPSIKWSQWMVDGTAVVGRPDEMNCSTAICAVASCIATRSARTLTGLGTWHCRPLLHAQADFGTWNLSVSLRTVPSAQCGGDRLGVGSVALSPQQAWHTRPQAQVADATLDVLVLRVIQVSIHVLRTAAACTLERVRVAAHRKQRLCSGLERLALTFQGATESLPRQLRNIVCR